MSRADARGGAPAPPTDRDTRVLHYLNGLRDTGAVNMYEAGSYLRRDLGLSRDQARDYVLRYMRSTVKGEFARGL